MEYNFSHIEPKWQNYWKERETYKVERDPSKPKYYVLDMFPYPSGAGLHVGHPLGYIASDIVSRYKRLSGFNVLHPMGYDAFGLPAEQYAIQTGRHPADTTKENIARYREQLDKLGFSFDWSREVQTCDPAYYKWTQWIFVQLFKSWYNCETNRAESIDTLIAVFEKEGFNGTTHQVLTGDIEHDVKPFSAEQWKQFTEQEKSAVLMNFRLAYLGEAWVNWCPQLGTVLANDEVKDGVSERGGYPVERKRMPQWSLRITAYADRLLNDPEQLDWSESIKEAQRNWIGKSEGTSLVFQVDGIDATIEVFTTRPDTIFGVTFVTLAPEHDLVSAITTSEYRDQVNNYVEVAKNKSERERQAEKKVSGQFTGAYVVHPFNGAKIPVYIGEYVLAGYGTGAVMAVPAHDTRDHAFAKQFGLAIPQVVTAPEGHDFDKESYDAKEGQCINSDFLNGLEVKAAIRKAIEEIERRGIGKGKVNYRLRDAAFGRQRYWGEPIPVYYKNGIPVTMNESDLPLVLPEVDKFLPTESGEPPLARAKDWSYQGFPLETTTMPGWAGSSWYFLRYMSPNETGDLVAKEDADYWKNVDLYLGGAEHATGHLLYVRFWTKFLYDIGKISVQEPAQKLINQGMIQGVSEYIHRVFQSPKFSSDTDVADSASFSRFAFSYVIGENSYQSQRGFSLNVPNATGFVSAELAKELNQSRNETWSKPIDIQFTSSSVLDIEKFLTAQNSTNDPVINPVFIKKEKYWFEGTWYDFDGNPLANQSENVFLTESVVEKMSKSKLNVVTPDAICAEYGADTLRLYEMFLGPLEQHKPWSTNGISGTHNFLKRFWRLFYAGGNLNISNDTASEAELKVLHRTLKKIKEDIEKMSFNTAVSSFMICVNELTDLKCNKRAILEPLTIALAPFAPHITEELWSLLGHNTSIVFAEFPDVEEKYLVDSTINYPIQFNGKMRFTLPLPADLDTAAVEQQVLSSAEAQKYLDGKTPKKVIVVPKKIVNVVL